MVVSVDMTLYRELVRSEWLAKAASVFKNRAGENDFAARLHRAVFVFFSIMSSRLSLGRLCERLRAEAGI